jgi:hypothetical protein
MPEIETEIGRVGTKRVKRLLEATTRFRLPYNAYQHAERVSLEMLTGVIETYDLNGDYLDEHGNEVTRIYVESKSVDGAGSQSIEFRRFLAQAYSATLVGNEKGLDPKYEFMWATTCPWKGDGFRQVATWEAVRDAVIWEAARDVDKILIKGKKVPRVIPEDHVVDDGLARTVAARIWVWVIAERHEEMSLGEEMRRWVQAQFSGGGTL